MRKHAANIDNSFDRLRHEKLYYNLKLVNSKHDCEIFVFFLAEFKRERNYGVNGTLEYRLFINIKQLTFLEKANERLCGSPR